jgi:hypothetical protein
MEVLEVGNSGCKRLNHPFLMTRMLNPSSTYPERDWIVELSPAPHVSNGETGVQNGQDVTKTPGLLSLYGNKRTEIE